MFYSLSEWLPRAETGDKSLKVTVMVLMMIVGNEYVQEGLFAPADQSWQTINTEVHLHESSLLYFKRTRLFHCKRFPT